MQPCKMQPWMWTCDELIALKLRKNFLKEFEKLRKTAEELFECVWAFCGVGV